MDFPTAVKTCVLQKYVDLKGRASRSEYWWFTLAYLIVYIPVVIVDSVLGLQGILTLLLALIPLVGVLLLLYWYAQKGTTGNNLYGADPLA